MVRGEDAARRGDHRPAAVGERVLGAFLDGDDRMADPRPAALSPTRKTRAARARVSLRSRRFVFRRVTPRGDGADANPRQARFDLRVRHRRLRVTTYVALTRARMLRNTEPVKRIGAHMSVAGGVHTAFSRAESVGCTALQIFVKNASQWSGKPIPDDHARLFCEERHRTGIDRVVAHASYLINLASPDAELHRKSTAALVDELERCERLGLDGLVLHPGSHVGTGEAKGLRRVARGLDAAFRETRGMRCPVLLETTAGQGTNLGHRFEHLARIMDLVREPDRVATCLDTCHVFAAGYDLRTRRLVRATLDRFDEVCGLDRLRAIHLNDSLKPFASPARPARPHRRRRDRP